MRIGDGSDRAQLALGGAKKRPDCLNAARASGSSSAARAIAATGVKTGDEWTSGTFGKG